ncbi:MAG: glycoside hydrolase family 43 protein [Candidatus Limivivens sp.]|nr:glycoside hydrolase family 43 protein [Candidatus Limivivens sp.]
MLQNPILKGFCPDPSIIRVGEDYYIATSTFEWWPGVRLWHSKDLAHWEQLPSPLNRTSQLNMLGDPTSGGIWAPDISYDGQRFYLVFTDVKTKKGRYYNNHNYVVWADSINGPWSEPVYLNSTGFDPSMLHDTDGRKYLVNMRNGFRGVLVQEFDPESGKLVGEVKNVFRGTEIGYTEGPHIYHIGDWYYCLAAEGGTGYDHCVTMARSRSLWGPYEVDPENPVLTSEREDLSMLQKCGHGDLVETQNGEWYLVHLCARPPHGEKKCVLGRETGIQKVYWNEEGWLRLVSGGRIGQNETESPSGIEACPLPEPAERDDFDSTVLGVRYSVPRVPLGDCCSLRERPGWLRLYGQESLNSLHHVSLAAVRQTEYQAYAETCMEFSPDCPEQLAGLSYMYDASNFYLFGKTTDEEGREVLTVVKSDWLVTTDETDPILLPAHERLWLRIETGRGEARCFYSLDGQSWTDTGAVLDTEILTDEHCRGFTGAHLGMYCHDMTGKKRYADFDYFACRSWED